MELSKKQFRTIVFAQTNVLSKLRTKQKIIIIIVNIILIETLNWHRKFKQKIVELIFGCDLDIIWNYQHLKFKKCSYKKSQLVRFAFDF